MGRYANWPDVAGRYPDIAKVADATGTGSHWLSHAENELDARLASKYTVPFSGTIPPLVKDLTIDMTYWRMTMRQKGSEVIKEFINERIMGLVEGTITLTDTSGGALDGTTLAWSEQDKTGYHTAFGPDNALNWRTSSAYVTDVQGDRGQT